MTSQPAQILLIDDRPEIESALVTCLRKDPIEVTAARDGRLGVELALERRFDLILLDVEMPEMDGFEVLQRLKNTESTKAVPVMMVSGYDTLPDKVRSFELGASDYIVKPFQSAELRARVRAILKAQQLNRLLARAERDLGETRRQLAEALAAKDRMIEAADSCLRAPLASNQAIAGLLQQLGKGSPVAELAQTLQANNGSVLESVSDLIDLAAIQHGQLALAPQPFELRGCLEEVLALFAAKAADKGLELVGLIAESLPQRVVGDAQRVRQILERLVESALNRTTQGEVVLQVEADTSTGASGQLHFLIRDTGTVITAARLEQLFTPFAATGGELSLAICHAVAGAMGGRVWIESTPERGTVAHVSIALAPDAEAESNQAPQLPSRMAGLTLVVADASEAANLALCQQAQTLGLRAVSVTSWQELANYLSQPQPCDLLVVDDRLHESGGLPLCQEILRLGLPHPPKVLIAASRFPAWPAKVLEENGVAAVLAKPAPLATVRETLRRVWEGRLFVEETPQLAQLDPTLAARMPVRILAIAATGVTQTLLRHILRGFGFAAEFAGDAQAARDALQSEVPFGIIFLDAEMDGLDPADSVRQVRARERARGRENEAPELPPSIFIAMSRLVHARDQFLSAGMDDFLPKPPTIEAVLNLLENWAPWAGSSAANAGLPLPAAIEPPPAPPLELPPVPALKLANEAYAPPLPEIEPEPMPEPEAGEAPVDFEMLMQEAEGDWNGLFELIDLYLDQTEHRFEQLITAMSLANAKEIEELARSGAGASRTCGIISLIKPLTDMENMAREGNLEGAELACSEAIQEYERLRAYLDRQRRLHLRPKG